MDILLIVGLGNPEKKYENTRHNVGFDVIDILSGKYDIPVETRKCKSLIGRGRIHGRDVLLVKPQTYMNLSGEAIRGLMDFFDIPIENVAVFCDDVYLDLGVLRIRKGGSAGGHNGLKNIILHTGTEEFKRIRIGVGKQPEEMDLVRFVLSHFSREERKTLDEACRDAADAVMMLFEEGIDRTMNVYNGKRAK